MPENTVSTSPTENTEICKYCGMNVKANAQFCSTCGNPIIPKASKIFCTMCGAELGYGEMFCSKCGFSTQINTNAQALNNIAAYNESISTNKSENAKKKKTLLIVLIVFAVVVLLAAVACFVIIPQAKSWLVSDEPEKDNYDSAHSEYSERSEYSEHSEYSEITEKGEYHTSEANSDERKYQEACDKLDNKLYSEAIELFEALDGYKDSDTKILEAKYRYVNDNRNNYDKTTCRYLEELKSEHYKDSADIYDELYEWKVTIVAVNSNQDDSNTDKDSISKYNAVYFHIKVEGGKPDEKIWLKAESTLPNGEEDEYIFNCEFYDGEYGWYGFEEGIYIDPQYGKTGNLQCRIYNYETGELLDVRTVWISN